MKLLTTFLAIALLAFGVLAQQPKPLAVSPDQPVANDDRGQAFILTRDLQPLSAFNHLRKAPISEPQQFSVFVGRDWAGATLHAREPQLQSLLTNVTSEADLAALQENGIKNRFGPAFSVERLDVEPGTISDLDVQRLLAAMLAEGVLPQPNARTILVIFLDANLQSTLGSLAAGKHYAAYHSAFNFDGARIRYVVVPFESDPATGYQIALRAFVAAALKPTHTIAK